MQFTEAQVIELAPDDSSRKAGKDLANAKKWQTLAINERVLWGEVQGSGKDPYRTQVDMQSIAFKCSCPSRKFPCKHGLGLLFIYAQNTGAVVQTPTEPEWVKTWIEGRTAKAEKAAAPPPELDDKALEKKAKEQAKREESRAGKAQAAAAEMELFLKNLIRGGLLSLPEKDPAFFEKTALRMVDNQATGFTNLLRNFNKINYFSGNQWQSEALENVAQSWLLLGAFRNLEQLSVPTQQDTRSLVGWSTKREELLNSPDTECLQDHWLALAKHTETEDKLIIHRHWLFGTNSNRTALVIEFVHSSAPIQTLLLMPGTIFEATLAFYPSNLPYRALVKTQGPNQKSLHQKPNAAADWHTAQRDFAEKTALYPWLDDYPQLLSGLVLAKHQTNWYLKDHTGAAMSIPPAFGEQKMLQLLALTGGQKKDYFVLRTSGNVLPLAVLEDNGTFWAI